MILEIWNMFLSALNNFLQLDLIFKMLAVYNVLKLLYVVLMECHGILRFFYVYFNFLDWFLQRLSLLLLVNILLRSQLGNKKNSETKFQLLNYIFKSGPFPVSFYLFSSFQYSW